MKLFVCLDMDNSLRRSNRSTQGEPLTKRLKLDEDEISPSNRSGRKSNNSSKRSSAKKAANDSSLEDDDYDVDDMADIEQEQEMSISWEDAFAGELGNNWQKAFEYNNRNMQVTWLLQLCGMLFALDEEKNFQKISKDHRFVEKVNCCGKLIRAQMNVINCLIRCFLDNDTETTIFTKRKPQIHLSIKNIINPIALLLNQQANHSAIPMEKSHGIISKSIPGNIKSDAFIYFGGSTAGIFKSSPFIIGRTNQEDEEISDVSLSLNLNNLPGSSKISRKHCTISFSENFWILQDASTHGTKLNGNLLNGRSTNLNHGDLIEIQQHALRFYLSP